MVASLHSGSEGVTLTAASNVALLELGWTPGGVDQAIDRCHRIGQKNVVTPWFLVAESSIDEYVASLIDEKRKVVTASTDGQDVEQSSLLSELMDRLVRGHRAA
jgi:SWI/SNF-related matrix-associated actin-dependent regulator 1 of chromatin subfamily A